MLNCIEFGVKTTQFEVFFQRNLKKSCKQQDLNFIRGWIIWTSLWKPKSDNNIGDVRMFNAIIQFLFCSKVFNVQYIKIYS